MVCHNIGYDSGAIRPSLEHGRSPLRRDAADGHERTFDPRPPFSEPRETLGRPGHLFQSGGIDRAERHIVRICCERHLQLLIAMGADADLDVRGSDCGKVGGG